MIQFLIKAIIKFITIKTPIRTLLLDVFHRPKDITERSKANLKEFLVRR